MAIIGRGYFKAKRVKAKAHKPELSNGLIDAYVEIVHEQGFVKAHALTLKTLGGEVAWQVESEALERGLTYRENGRILVDYDKWTPSPSY
jgi:imidazolonepropionase-like amidohydrolase